MRARANDKAQPQGKRNGSSCNQSPLADTANLRWNCLLGLANAVTRLWSTVPRTEGRAHVSHHRQRSLWPASRGQLQLRAPKAQGTDLLRALAEANPGDLRRRDGRGQPPPQSPARAWPPARVLL